ncbi:MAG: hypothetical protein AAFY02_22545, partial [Pseudomonadota bacterium]
TFSMNVPPQLVASGRGPSLAILNPAEITDPNFTGFALTAINVENDPLVAGDFDWQFADAPAALPALHAFGPSRDDTSRTFVGDEIAPPPAPWMPSEWRVSDPRRLRELAVRPRDRTIKEWHRYLDGAGIIDDIGTDEN